MLIAELLHGLQQTRGLGLAQRRPPGPVAQDLRGADRHQSCIREPIDDSDGRERLVQEGRNGEKDVVEGGATLRVELRDGCVQHLHVRVVCHLLLHLCKLDRAAFHALLHGPVRGDFVGGLLRGAHFRDKLEPVHEGPLRLLHQDVDCTQLEVLTIAGYHDPQVGEQRLHRQLQRRLHLLVLGIILRKVDVAATCAAHVLGGEVSNGFFCAPRNNCHRLEHNLLI